MSNLEKAIAAAVEESVAQYAREYIESVVLERLHQAIQDALNKIVGTKTFDEYIEQACARAIGRIVEKRMEWTMTRVEHEFIARYARNHIDATLVRNVVRAEVREILEKRIVEPLKRAVREIDGEGLLHDVARDLLRKELRLQKGARH